LDERRLVDGELDAGTELEVTEVVIVELVGGTYLDKGRGRRMEHRRDGSASPGAR
jgi:hypothetical protein